MKTSLAAAMAAWAAGAVFGLGGVGLAETAAWRSPSGEKIAANLARLGEEAPEELLRNPRFEEGENGNPAGWSRGFWGNGGNRPEIAEQAIVRTDEAARSGEHSCKIDASLGDMRGRVFIIGQHLIGPHRPPEAIRGQTLRFSLWSMLQTAPHPDGNPVRLNVRQWKAGRVIRHHQTRVYNDTGEWSYGEAVFKVSEDAERVDVQAIVPNTLPTGQPAVMFLDDLSVMAAAEPPLEVDLLAPEVPQGAGLPLECRVASRLEEHGPLRLVHAVLRDGEPLEVFRNPAAAPVERASLPVDGLPVGEYRLKTVLEAEAAGPVALESRTFRVYEGPFAGE